MNVTVTPRSVTRFVAGIAAFFAIAYIATRYCIFFKGLRPSLYPLVLLDLNGEGNAPALFAGLQHWTCALLLALIGHADEKWSKQWKVFGCIFLFLGVDEWLGFHERLTHIFKLFHMNHGFFYFAWVIPYGLGCLALLFWYLKWLLALPARSRWLFMASGIIFVSGAIGCEMLSGPIVEHYGRDHIYFSIEVLIEESLEMTGLTCFIYSLLDHWKRHHPQTVLTVAMGHD